MNGKHKGAADLCREGDKILFSGDPGRAAALYTQAFGNHAGSTVRHVRGLDTGHLEEVIATLEAWLDGSSHNSIEGPSKGLVAVFLSTLCPNNVSASLYKMESVMQGTGQASDEIFARCSALLKGKQTPQPVGRTRLVLELTRALACLLSDPQNPKGPQLYLQAFNGNISETVRLVKERQTQHVELIIKAFYQQLSPRYPILQGKVQVEKKSYSTQASEYIDSSKAIEFLLAISPEDIRIRELQAAELFSSGKFTESAEALSLTLELGESQAEYAMTAEKRVCLLVSRAAAHFAAGGRAKEVCKDLGDGFALHPATARQQFQSLFSDSGIGTAARIQLRQQAEKGVSEFREAVLMRPDLRSSKGVELLDPVISQLRALCHLEPDGGGRELRVRLADCLLLRGEHREALSISSQLAAPAQQSYQNTVQVLRGYSRLFIEDHKGALEDFQAVIEHNTPHPPSCVRALCGRGILRMMAGSHYLTALDYATASRLQLQDAAVTVRCLVPWNCRGLLCTVLLEQGRVMLEGVEEEKAESNPTAQELEEGHINNKQRSPIGVHALALLLMELQPGTDGPQILTADALYQLGRVEEAYRLLLNIEHTAPRPPILARLAILQLHRGFLYDAYQLLKKLINSGDTTCLRPLLSVTSLQDRALLEKHCHTASKRILCGQQAESAIREAVAYLSIAIMASGGGAIDSLLERARCYALLGQWKTAIFDFTAILKKQPDNVQSLCGRAFTYLMLNQQKECTLDILAALQCGAKEATQSMLSLKDKARRLISEWLGQHCRKSLADILLSNPVPCREEHLREAFLISGALMNTDCREPRWHLLYIDTLLAKGDVNAAGAHLKQVFGQEPRDAAAKARWGIVKAWQQNYKVSASYLSVVAEKEPATLDFLISLLQSAQRKRLAQAASQQASCVSESGQWEQALALLTLAVRGVSEIKLQYLRQRAACLAQLGLHDRAVSDLSKVIQGHTADGREEQRVWAEDLCRRGRCLLLCSHEESGLQDFSQALDLHEEQALLCVEASLGRQRLAEMYLRFALQNYGEQKLEKAWFLTETGLKVDSGHVELRRLRARIKREVSGPCTVN
ncbi:tetratricopeptide repeat protein 34 isoform X1 [Danio rerio]|uniref:Tetratricopeptide repeat protein 34 isoform X1 n=2 Tax=Danio rerio TaxID=7955 RepID=A0AC58IL17_DANRE|nr:tetratricopeptide repeat protein 34 [Danio rerio]|eukprot:XP_685049.4 tetratricopeptide repeat protein 34 [Danio rerio]